ncbi:zeta toxin family protein [Streptomyces sp. NPDC058964]|uniref:zeta toxin family protein n=1 Tax=Streptomyces sp. NPDC058964 TaxID=3346681 RepID=UPI0036ADE475
MRRIAHPLPEAPGTGYHRLHPAQHRWAFDELIAPTHLDRAMRRAAAHPDPIVVYLVGEPGARQLEARRILRRAMRAGTAVLEPDLLRGTHPDHAQLINDSPRAAEELVRCDAEDWQAEAEAYVRERRGDLLIECDFTSAADFASSASWFARAGYRIEVVALAGRAADSRQPAAGSAPSSTTPAPWSWTRSPRSPRRPWTREPARRLTSWRPRPPTPGSVAAAGDRR